MANPLKLSSYVLLLTRCILLLIPNLTLTIIWEFVIIKQSLQINEGTWSLCGQETQPSLVTGKSGMLNHGLWAVTRYTKQAGRVDVCLGPPQPPGPSDKMSGFPHQCPPAPADRMESVLQAQALTRKQ